jgi:hypothetical protein
MKTLLTLFLATSLPLLAAEPNQLNAKEKKDGFVLLFDGKTLDGWRTYKEKEPNKEWIVEDGAITLTKKGGRDLITTEQYQDFDFRWQWKISAEGNSGVMWRVAETDGPAYKTGAEYQLLDSWSTKNYAHETKSKRVAGALYGLVDGKPEWSKKVGEWNESRILVQGTRLTLFLNGHTTADLDMNSDEWRTKLAASKFAKWPRFAKEPKGHLCFQDHGNKVAFRSIRIKVLK